MKQVFTFIHCVFLFITFAHAQSVSLDVVNDRATLKKHRVKSIISSSFQAYNDEITNPDSVKKSSFSTHTYTIDANGWTIQIYTANSDGDRDVIIKFEYSKNYTICNYSKWVNTNQLEMRMLVKYDKKGNKYHVAAPGYCEQFKYDTAGGPIEYLFRQGANPWKLAPENFVYDSLGTFDKYYYDTMGNLLKTLSSDRGDTETEAESFSYEYYDDGRIKTKKSAKNRQVHMPYTYSYVYSKNDTALITEETHEIQNRSTVKDISYFDIKTGNLKRIVDGHSGKTIQLVEYNKKGLITRISGWDRQTGYITFVRKFEYKYY